MNGKQTPCLMLQFQLCLSSFDREKIMYEEICLKFVWKFELINRYTRKREMEKCFSELYLFKNQHHGLD